MRFLLAAWLQVQGHWERSIALYRTNAVYVPRISEPFAALRGAVVLAETSM